MEPFLSNSMRREPNSNIHGITKFCTKSNDSILLKTILYRMIVSNNMISLCTFSWDSLKARDINFLKMIGKAWRECRQPQGQRYQFLLKRLGKLNVNVENWGRLNTDANLERTYNWFTRWTCYILPTMKRFIHII